MAHGAAGGRGRGTLVLSEAGAGNLLLLLVAADAAFGDLLFDLRRDRPTLGALL